MERLHKQVSGTDEELIKRMHDIDKHRADYYRYYTGHDCEDYEESSYTMTQVWDWR